MLSAGPAISCRLVQLSPFTSIDLEGRESLALMQHLCANDVDVAEGNVVYTQMLNRHGGIEADVTVSRTDEAAFRTVSGAATRQKDLARRGSSDVMLIEKAEAIGALWFAPPFSTPQQIQKRQDNLSVGCESSGDQACRPGGTRNGSLAC